MQITIELPDDFVTLAFTAIATETKLIGTDVKTFTSCCNIKDGIKIRVSERAGSGYNAEVEE